MGALSMAHVVTDLEIGEKSEKEQRAVWCMDLVRKESSKESNEKRELAHKRRWEQWVGSCVRVSGVQHLRRSVHGRLAGCSASCLWLRGWCAIAASLQSFSGWAS